MDKFKCNLYIVGRPSTGKSFLITMLEDFIRTDRQSIGDRYKDSDWTIRTENVSIEVEIRESRTFDLPIVHYSTKELTTIVLYILDNEKNQPSVTIPSTHINSLKGLSKHAIIIVASALRDNELNRKMSLGNLKKLLPFVEYFLPIMGTRVREYDSLYQFNYLLRRIIINSHSSSLKRVKELIKTNFETKNPTLDLGNCGLTSLNDIKELFLNTHLQKLILSNEWGEYQNGSWVRRISNNKLEPNVLFGFPKEIANLKNLETLVSGGNWRSSKRRTAYFVSYWHIVDLKPLSHLKKLAVLNVSNNQIESITSLSGLSNLTKLYLNNNLISRFPSIDKFPRLKELYLSNNRVKDIKFLAAHSVVQTIDLHSNHITDLTPIKNLISKIGIKDSKWENKTISISNNPLAIPPSEVVAKGKNSVMAYFSQLEAEKEIQIQPFINADIKLIMVGNSNVGKSTYVKWLKTGKVDKTIATTHWLDFGIWKAARKSKNYNVRIFDFGGQEYYHDTHHLFFTNRTAYALIWEGKPNEFNEVEISQTQSDGKKKTVKVESFPLEYWLDSIRYHTQKRGVSQIEKSITKILDERDKQIESLSQGAEWPKIVIESTNRVSEAMEEEENILVLQNKVDLRKSKYYLNEESIKKRYPKIYDFEQISLYNDVRLDLSKEILFDIFDSLEVLNRQYLGTWHYIKEDIEKQNFDNDLPINEFLKYCNNLIKKLPELKGKSNTQIAKVLFSLEDAQVFASFLADIGLCLFYPENNLLRGKVFLNQNQILHDINQVLSDIDKTTGEISVSDIANSLSKIKSSAKAADVINLMLHFKILFRHPLASKNSFVAPLYLPQSPPKSIKLFQSLFGKPVYRFHYETFIHKSVILDFFHHYGSKTLSETSDDSSFYFWRNGIVIKGDAANDILMVEFVPGNNDTESASLDIYAVSGVNDSFIKEVVNYIDSINQGINVKKLVPNESNEEFVPLDIIHQNEKDQNQIFYFNNKYYKLTSFKKYLSSPLKMKKLFISYSKQDIRLVNKFIEHLSALQKDGKVSHWYCSELEAGSVWNDEIQKHLAESDIVCFMVSPNFMKTEYIHEHEIKRAFERRAKDKNFKIVPIILNFCRWTTTNNNLGDFTALPYTAKPVVDFDNQDMAWYIVEECLRMMIDKDLDPTGEDFYMNVLPSDLLKIYTRIIEGKVDKNSV